MMHDEGHGARALHVGFRPGAVGLSQPLDVVWALVAEMR